MPAPASVLRRTVHVVLATILAAGTPLLLAGAAPADLTPSVAADQTIGYPTFGGPDPVPPEPADYTVQGMMRAIYEAEKDGTDFWMDRLLARRGSDPAGNQWLWTRGRALYMYTHTANTIGFGGQTAYWDTIDGRSMYTVALGEGGYSGTTASRVQTPSYWQQTFTNASAGISVLVTKFITQNNVAVTNLAITNTGTSAQAVPIRVTSPYATTPDGDELTGIVDARRGLTILFPRLSGDGLDVDGDALAGSVTVGPGETVETKVTMGFVTDEIPQSRTDYQRYRDLSPADAFGRHVRAYNEWWADNVPYIDVPDEGIKKLIYYRWWIIRFNFLDADIPGNDFQFPVGIEGVLGYNNAIALTIPMFIDELKYLRDPLYAYGTMLSAGEQSENGSYADNPGEPDNWNDAYLQYTTDAAWRAYQIHGGQPAILRNLAHYGEEDVKDQLAVRRMGHANDNEHLLWYCCNFLNGNDADNPSFSFHNRGNERVESAYVHANALATAAAYEAIGRPAKAAEMRQIAADVRQAILDELWDPASRLFLHRDVQTDTLIPWKEINNYYPFTVGLVPNEAPYTDALRLFDDPAEYPIFPFYTANQRDKQAAAAIGRGGSNNFSQINSTVQFRLLSSVLRNYDTDALDAEWYKKLLYWNAWAHYINGNTAWPDANEFWFNWNPTNQTIGRSGIHHSMLGSNNWTIVEDVAGLRARSDDKLELWPIDIGWDHFTVNHLRYRGSDLTIVWDAPGDGTVHYPGVPEGYSAYLGGQRAFTVDRLVHSVWDPNTGLVTFPAGDGTVLSSAAITAAKAPGEVVLSSERVVDIFQKAGVDLTAALPNLAPAATPSASFDDPSDATPAYPASDPGAAIDGFTINIPFWGSAGSGNTRDWYELDFGRPTTFTQVKLYFYNDRQILGIPNQHRQTTPTGRYREPALYSIQVFREDTGWVDVKDQVKSPIYPRSNLDTVTFSPTTASRMRVLMLHRQGYGTGLKEVQVFRQGGSPPRKPVNQPPSVVVRLDPTFTGGAGQVRLEAIVKDDGLPNGTLTTRWSVVSGPDLALFDDRTLQRPILRYAVGGTYVVELRASDSARVTTARLSLELPNIDAPNVAPLATPTCTNTSPWESCAAINMASDGSTPPQYGTWPTNGDQWVQLTWDDPVRVDSADMWFFQDVPPGANGGVQAPASWDIQYWDEEGGQFVDVANASGYGTALNQFNSVSFDPVTTSRLRANLYARANQASAEGIGVRRWRVYAESPVSVDPVEMTTTVGQHPDLPKTVTLRYEGGDSAQANVYWEEVTDEQVAEPGTFTVRGLVEASSLIAEAHVTVVESSP